MPSRVYKKWLARFHANRARKAAHKAMKSQRATARSQRRTNYLNALAARHLGQRELWRAA